MYPQGELTDLSRRKALLRQRIGRRRAECAAAAAEVTRPLEWLEDAQRVWQRVSPLAHIAGG